MRKPAIPMNETARVAALKKLNILDTPPEKEYDDIAKLAAFICQTPIALISLVDEKRQWFKSKVGTELCESDRDYSFCAHAINSPSKIMEVPDARVDKRFKDNPLTAHEETPVIFYSGVPLQDNKGNVLGTLCVIDNKPKQLTEVQKEALSSLANQVVQLFELRRKNRLLKKSAKKLKKKNELLKEFAATVSHDMKMPLSNIILTIDVLKTKYSSFIDKQGIAYLDSLKQSTFSMSDYISSMLTYYESDAIAAKSKRNEVFDAHHLLEEIIDLFNIQENCEINFPEDTIDIQCNKIALEQIFLNLIGNSLKYNDKEKIVINIKWEEAEDYYKFSITDNGIGIPTDKKKEIFTLFSTVAERDRNGNKGNGIGLSTVKKLVSFLGGKIKVSSELGKYTTFHFTVKKSVCKKTA